jgi:AraC-like DNA-binding protein
LRRAMPSQSYVPPAGHPLQPFVLAIFHVDRAVDFTCEWILPKGNVDILVNLGAPIRAAGSSFDTTIGTHRVLVAGMHTHAIRTWPQGRINLVGMSLVAHASAAVLPVPPGELRDNYVDGCSICPDLAAVAAQVAEAPTFAARVAVLLSWLERRLAPSRRSEIVRRSAAALRRRPSEELVTDLARQHDVSTRQLHRLFTECLGVGPAHYARLARFTQALELMERMPRLTDIAHAAHYTDQAHLCHDFKSIASMTPKQYLKNTDRVVPGHLYER